MRMRRIFIFASRLQNFMFYKQRVKITSVLTHVALPQRVTVATKFTFKQIKFKPLIGKRILNGKVSRTEDLGIRRLEPQNVLPTARIFKFLLDLFRQTGHSDKKKKGKRKNPMSNTVEHRLNIFLNGLYLRACK